MRLHWFALALLVALNGITMADELPEATEDLSPEVQERASYAVGFEFGSNLNRAMKDQALPLLVDAVLTGLRDAIDGKEPAFSEEDLRNASNEFRKASVTRLATKNKQEGEKFLQANSKKKGVVTLDSGLQYEVLKKGTGPSPSATDKVRTHYHGTLLDGTVFDSSVERGEPVTFGVNEVIPGWTEALQLMKVGDKWKLYLPSNLAYGVNGAPGIAPNSVLVFEVELLGVVKGQNR